jgi:UDP-N-acetylmuramoylalanine--D-glutamate ligase
MGAFDGERAVVVGAGVAGVAAAAAFAAEGATVRITEARTRGALGDLSAIEDLGVEILTGGHRAAHLDGATVVMVSPGIPPSTEVVAWARERSLRMWGELELGARLARVPYLAVTGTNGKTTTTGMLAACLRAGGVDAVACGNIGNPFPTAARENHEALVVECSSFQLSLQESFHPRVSALLNLAPDHIDWHGSIEAYVAAKARVYENQRAHDVHVGNRDDADAGRLSARAPCDLTWFRLGEPSAGETGYIDDVLVSRIAGDVPLGSIDGERAGFRADAAAAAAAALAFGVGPEAVAMGIAAYEPARHRGEVVAVVDGVRFVDNSKATNVHAALAAIDSVTNAVLIAGGRAKGAGLSALATRVSRLIAVVALGEAADELSRVFAEQLDVYRANSMEDATRRAFTLATSGDTVLLAPACASWDMFHDYAERGDRFAAAARAIREEATPA